MTKADDSSLDEKLWKQEKIKPGEIIGNVQIMFDRQDSRLLGIKFQDKTGKDLISAGPINLENYRTVKTNCL